ncbi:MAG: hypothetical protein HYU52_15195 [Acidobacteria bacterium]|nr:hypothetical protein [Acidobacteriota bacterium]
MAAKGRRKAAKQGSRPSTFFIVAFAVALILLIVAFVVFVSQTPGAKPKEKRSAVARVEIVS